MIVAADRSEVTPASLTRAVADTPNFAGLTSVGEKFGRSLASFFQSIGYGDVVVSPTAVIVQSVSEWQKAQGDFDALLRFQMRPLKASMSLCIPADLLARLVDIYFGGDGDVEATQRELSASECRFLGRMSEHCLPALGVAWKGIAPLEPQIEIVDNLCNVAAPGVGEDLIVIQTLSVVGSAGSAQIQCVFPLAPLRSIDGLYAASGEDMPASPDRIWRDRLTEATLQAHVPVRSIFARPELPLDKLMSLKVGDVIPVLMPSQIPLTIGGKVFAHGSVGQSAGRAAIKIESLVQERPFHE